MVVLMRNDDPRSFPVPDGIAPRAGAICFAGNVGVGRRIRRARPVAGCAAAESGILYARFGPDSGTKGENRGGFGETTREHPPNGGASAANHS